MVANNLILDNNKFQIKPISKNAKVSYSTKQDDELALFNLPVLPLILNYLNQKDKIELSSVNKSLRLRLEPLIFRKIKLFPDNYLANPTQYGRKLNNKSIQSILLDQVIKSIGTKNHLVKEIVIKEDFNRKFAKKFFSVFYHTKNLSFENACFQKPILADIVKPLKNLEHLHFESFYMPNYSNPSNFNIDFQLPKTIKTFISEGYHGYYTYLDPLQKIDETYTNLQSITLTNPEMFNQFKNHHPSLVELDISHHTLSDIPLIEEILANNPQITKLSLPGTQFTESLMNTIFNLQHLSVLKLTHSSEYQDYTNWTLIDNWTITTIQIIHSIGWQIQSFLLNSCKNLQKIQFRFGSLQSNMIPWHSYHGSLKLIEFTYFRYIHGTFDEYISCSSLEQIVLRDPDDKWDNAILEKLDELNHWKVTKGKAIILTRLN